MTNVQIESVEGAQRTSLCAQKEDHLRQAGNLYSSLRTNTRLSSHIATVTFDFQQNLLSPHIPIGSMYMHRLWLYVFGVHEYGTNCAVMYCCPEFIVTKRSSEVVYV